MILPVEVIHDAKGMKVRLSFGQLDVAFAFGNVDITVIAVLEAVEEIQAAESGQTPLDAYLCANGADKLAAVTLLVRGRIKRVLQFAPEIGLKGFAGHSELSTETRAK